MEYDSRIVYLEMTALRFSARGVDGIEEFGIDKLIQIGASQLSDQLPESRDAACALLLELQSAYEKSNLLEPTATVSEEPSKVSWEHFCQSKLSPLSAQAFLRVTTSISQAGFVSCSLHKHGFTYKETSGSKLYICDAYYPGQCEMQGTIYGWRCRGRSCLLGETRGYGHSKKCF